MEGYKKDLTMCICEAYTYTSRLAQRIEEDKIQNPAGALTVVVKLSSNCTVY